MKCTKCGDRVTYDFNKQWNCPSCGEQYTLDQVMQSSPMTTGLQAGPKDPGTCTACGAEVLVGVKNANGIFCSVSCAQTTPELIRPWFDEPEPASEYPTCIKCQAELCEALDRTPADPPGPLVRCIRCKDSRKGTKEGWSW
jgi:hypothetical protein